jgi:hypothetical protein
MAKPSRATMGWEEVEPLLREAMGDSDNGASQARPVGERLVILEREAQRSAKFRHDARNEHATQRERLTRLEERGNLASALNGLTDAISESTRQNAEALSEALSAVAESSRASGVASEQARVAVDALATRQDKSEGVQLAAAETLTRLVVSQKAHREDINELKQVRKSDRGARWEAWKIALAVIAILVPAILSAIALIRSS